MAGNSSCSVTLPLALGMQFRRSGFGGLWPSPSCTTWRPCPPSTNNFWLRSAPSVAGDSDSSNPGPNLPVATSFLPCCNSGVVGRPGFLLFSNDAGAHVYVCWQVVYYARGSAHVHRGAGGGVDSGCSSSKLGCQCHYATSCTRCMLCMLAGDRGAESDCAVGLCRLHGVPEADETRRHGSVPGILWPPHWRTPSGLRAWTVTMASASLPCTFST